MKTLKIDDPILSYEGKPFTDNLRDGADKAIYFKDIFIQVLGPMFQARGAVDAEQIILAHKVGQKLFDCESESIELEDAEFNLLKEAAESPSSIQRFPTTILAPVYERLRNTKDSEE